MSTREALITLIEAQPIEDQLFIRQHLIKKFEKKKEEQFLLVRHRTKGEIPLPYYQIVSVSTNVEKSNKLDVTTSHPEHPVCECNGPLKNLAARLPKEEFRQIHRSHLIRLVSAAEITRSKAILKDGRQFKITRKFRKEAGTNNHNPE